MNTFLDNLLQKGTLPSVDVNVTIDNSSILKLAGAFLTVVVIGALLHVVLSKQVK